MFPLWCVKIKLHRAVVSGWNKSIRITFYNPVFQDYIFLELTLLSKMNVTHRSSVQFSCSIVSDSATPWTTACQASLSITNSWSLPKHMSIELVMPSNHLILCRPLLRLPSIFPSIRVFSNEPALCMRQPKYWSFSLSISPSNEHPGLISFRMDWLDLLAVEATLKSLLQHYSSKASIQLPIFELYLVEGIISPEGAYLIKFSKCGPHLVQSQKL